jgi:prolyl oligopeptidase
LSAENASNFKLCRTNINTRNFKNPEILVLEDTNAVISDFVVAQSNIYYVKTKNGVDARLYLLKNSLEQEVSIPSPSGNIILSSKLSNSNDWWIQIEGWSNYRTRYYFDTNLNTFIKQNLYPNQDLEGFNNVIVEEIEVPSHDGEKVPLSIIYKNGTKLDGSNRVFMDGYGCIGTSMTPYPLDFLKHWIHEGGIYAVAHVRGGGEKGEAWHMGGYKQTKPNTWKDFIACTEYLIEKEYTSPNKIAIWSGSGGGILIARAITERPDLYKAAIIYAGLINMLRAEFGLNGQNLIREFGTVNDSSEFHALLAMDAYQHLKKGINYPSVLLQAGANDSRVPIWHSAKFVAKLNAANASENQVLLSINFNIGHGVNFTVEDWDKIVADAISFALWQTGHPDFQLKE